MELDYPPTHGLLVAVRECVDELSWALGGRDRYQARVAVTALRIIERELAMAPCVEDEERGDLQHLLAHTSDDIGQLTELLVQRIREGAYDYDPAVAEYLKRSRTRRLQVTNPDWIEEDRG